MAQPAELFDTADADGLREDVSDLIFNIAPTETPFLSAIGTTTAGNIYHQWQTDALATPASNAAIEGDDAVLDAISKTTLVANYTQISTKIYGVSGTLEVTEKYGRDSEIAYQAAKAARELKTDVDFAMTGVNQASLPGDSTTARLSGSLEAWLVSNISLAATGQAGGFASGIVAARDDAGTDRALSQALIDTVMQSCWSNGGKPSMLLCGPVQKTNISGMDGVGTMGASGVTRTDRSDRTIYATADLYVSNFGEMRVVPSRHIRVVTGADQNLFLVDPEYAKTAYLRPWQQYDLAKTGDSIRRQMLVEWTLEMCNEAAHGMVADLT